MRLLCATLLALLAVTAPAAEPLSVTVEARAGGRRVGRLTRRARGTLRLSVPLRRGTRGRLTVRVTATLPGGGTDELTRRVRLRAR